MRIRNGGNNDDGDGDIRWCLLKIYVYWVFGIGYSFFVYVGDSLL